MPFLTLHFYRSLSGVAPLCPSVRPTNTSESAKNGSSRGPEDLRARCERSGPLENFKKVFKKKLLIRLIGCDSLKCPFNSKAGLLFFNARHDDSGPRRSIFAENPRKTASAQGHCKLKGRRKTPILMQENTENEGKTTSRAEKCHGGR